MKKTNDIGLIACVVIIILFAIFITIFMFNNKNNSQLLSNEINTNIYSEHTHNNIDSNNIVALKKTYMDIASYTTKIQDTDKNRIYNITLASEKLDGHIVTPNTEFSFNNKMGNMGATDGYKKALGFDSNGNKIKMYGGGICQISSTLYNAVMAANLKVTERHAHSRRVYYVPKNKDATVFSGGPDFKFINTLQNNIMICVHTDGYKVTVTLKEEKII